MNTPIDDIQTLPQVQDTETLAMQNLFQRAADTIVNASKLGKEVQALREQMKAILADAERMREHITWLEQENATLRASRDDAQNSLSAAVGRIDTLISDVNHFSHKLTQVEGEREGARADANLWEAEAQRLETERNNVTVERDKLKSMLESVWANIKEHFTPKPVISDPIKTDYVDPHHSAPKPEPTPAPVAGGYDTINPTY